MNRNVIANRPENEGGSLDGVEVRPEGTRCLTPSADGVKGVAFGRCDQASLPARGQSIGGGVGHVGSIEGELAVGVAGGPEGIAG